MGERQPLNSSLQGDNDQGRQHVEQPYIQMAATGTPEHGPFIYTMNNFTVEGEQLNPQPNSASMSVGYSSSTFDAELPHYHMQIPGQSSHDPLVHLSAGGGSLNMVPGSYGSHVSSSDHNGQVSNHNGQVFHRVNDGFLEPTLANNRGQLKRRNPGFPVIRERGSTSRYLDAGSSSDHFIPPPNAQLDASNPDSFHAPWNGVNLYRGIGLSIGGEGQPRNVRSRPSFDLENNQAHVPFSNPPHPPPFTMNFDNPSSMGFLATNLTAPSEYNPAFPLPASFGRNTVSDPNLFGRESSHFSVVNGNPGASHWMGGPVNGSFSNRNAVTQSLHDLSGHHGRGIRSSYVQGPVATIEAASRNLSIGNTSLPDQGTQFAEDGTHASRYPRQLSTLVLRTSERNGRNRISGDRYRPAEGARIRDRLMNEVMNAQNSAVNVSRSLFDQHRDMRLDIDNMSYEELVALVERIGNVSTGLSDDLFPKCLTELIYCSSDHVQDEARCVVCLVTTTSFFSSFNQFFFLQIMTVVSFACMVEKSLPLYISSVSQHKLAQMVRTTHFLHKAVGSILDYKRSKRLRHTFLPNLVYVDILILCFNGGIGFECFGRKNTNTWMI